MWLLRLRRLVPGPEAMAVPELEKVHAGTRPACLAVLDWHPDQPGAADDRAACNRSRTQSLSPQLQSCQPCQAGQASAAAPQTQQRPPAPGCTGCATKAGHLLLQATGL